MAISFGMKTSPEASNDKQDPHPEARQPPHSFEEGLLLLLFNNNIKNVAMIADYVQLKHQVPRGFVAMRDILKCKI